MFSKARPKTRADCPATAKISSSGRSVPSAAAFSGFRDSVALILCCHCTPGLHSEHGPNSVARRQPRGVRSSPACLRARCVHRRELLQQRERAELPRECGVRRNLRSLHSPTCLLSSCACCRGAMCSADGLTWMLMASGARVDGPDRFGGRQLKGRWGVPTTARRVAFE